MSRQIFDHAPIWIWKQKFAFWIRGVYLLEKSGKWYESTSSESLFQVDYKYFEKIWFFSSSLRDGWLKVGSANKIKNDIELNFLFTNIKYYIKFLIWHNLGADNPNFTMKPTTSQRTSSCWLCEVEMRNRSGKFAISHPGS